MWSKISLRLKITIITAVALFLVTVCITWFANYNVLRNVITPLENIDDERFEFDITFRIDFDEHTEELGQILYAQDGMLAMQLQVSQYDFRNYSIVAAVIISLIGTIGAYVISGQALKPIKSLAGKMEDIDANNLTAQIEPPQANDEISRLTHSFNNMLGKLNRTFENQKLFAQNAAHELKTPLASIRANIEVLRIDDEPTASDYKVVVDIVSDSTERLIAIVEGLLHLNSKIDESDWQIFYSKAFFEKIIDELKEDIIQKGLIVTVSGDCHIKGDKALLERAFSNLVHNAVRYNVDNGTVSINLTDGSIVIEDSGVGIPAEDLEHIFEPFYVVDKSRTKSLGGHGLGMAIAKNIFDSHSMEIQIQSELEKGTVINVLSAKNKSMEKII
jgi:signal transduction histidine kinase